MNDFDRDAFTVVDGDRWVPVPLVPEMDASEESRRALSWVLSGEPSTGAVL